MSHLDLESSFITPAYVTAAINPGNPDVTQVIAVQDDECKAVLIARLHVNKASILGQETRKRTLGTH